MRTHPLTPHPSFECVRDAACRERLTRSEEAAQKARGVSISRVLGKPISKVSARNKPSPFAPTNPGDVQVLAIPSVLVSNHKPSVYFAADDDAPAVLVPTKPRTAGAGGGGRASNRGSAWLDALRDLQMPFHETQTFWLSQLHQMRHTELKSSRCVQEIALLVNVLQDLVVGLNDPATKEGLNRMDQITLILFYLNTLPLTHVLIQVSQLGTAADSAWHLGRRLGAAEDTSDTDGGGTDGGGGGGEVASRASTIEMLAKELLFRCRSIIAASVRSFSSHPSVEAWNTLDILLADSCIKLQAQRSAGERGYLLLGNLQPDASTVLNGTAAESFEAPVLPGALTEAAQGSGAQTAASPADGRVAGGAEPAAAAVSDLPSDKWRSILGMPSGKYA